MISVNKNTNFDNIVISKAARSAIAAGVKHGDPVANLEYLGLSLRTINILENSEYAIMHLEQLVARSRDELLAIPNITPSVMREILNALSRYDELPQAQLTSPPMF